MSEVNTNTLPLPFVSGSKRARRPKRPLDYDDFEWQHYWRSNSIRSEDISSIVSFHLPLMNENERRRLLLSTDVLPARTAETLPRLRLERNSRTHYVSETTLRSDDGVGDDDTVRNITLFDRTNWSVDDVSHGMEYRPDEGEGPIMALIIGNNPCSSYDSSIQSIHSASDDSSIVSSADSMPQEDRRLLNDILCDEVLDDDRDEPMIGPNLESWYPVPVSEDGNVTPVYHNLEAPATPVTPATDGDYDSHESAIV